MLGQSLIRNLGTEYLWMTEFRHSLITYRFMAVILLLKSKTSPILQVTALIYVLITSKHEAYWNLKYRDYIHAGEESKSEYWCHSACKSIPVAMRSKAWVCGNSLAGTAGSKPAGAWMFVSCKCCVLSGRSLCDGPIAHPEEPYRVFVCVCVSLSVIKSNNNLYTYNE